MKRTMSQKDLLCCCSKYNICKCGITKQQLGMWQKDLSCCCSEYNCKCGITNLFP
jgi:hypothetical protein